MVSRNFIDGQIIQEIKRKKEQLDSCGNCIIKNTIQRYIEHCVENEATLHSYRIEHDSEFFKTDYNTHASRKAIRKGSKNIKNAMTWGIKNLNLDKFNQKFIQELAVRTAPESFISDFGYYRTRGVRVSDANWTPPYVEKLPREMERLTQFITWNTNKDDISTVVESALYAHLHLVRIHPFDDGNGRTARTLQNVMLESVGLPPPIIYAGERHDYYGHLQNAINGWRDRTGSDSDQIGDSPAENSFYDYMAGKISASLDRVLIR